MSKIIYSIDVEKDLHGGGYRGITKGLVEFEKICDKHNIKPVLYVTGECLIKNSKLFKRWNKKGWEISSHGFSHNRFDDMTYSHKEEEIIKILHTFKKYLGIKPKGFRAPQHSIDSETLDLLSKYGFEYDSSYTPLNALQLLFFPKRIVSITRLFFSPLQEYKIRKNLRELPTSAIILPFVSLIVRVFPYFILERYVRLIKILYKKPVFYAHSWDFIKLEGSRIDGFLNHKMFISKLECIIKNE